jgi:small subunit ribosomal protein S1
VTNITDYGAFVELEAGVEGLVHVSEMSWTKKNVHPGKIVSTSQEVEVVVLDVDPQKRRISLGLKQCFPNPWQAFLADHPAGSEIEGEIKNITEFGLFVGLPGEIDGMVHMSDIAWDQAGEQAIAAFSKGDKVKAKILEVDVEKERISLGIKQLSEDPMEQTQALKKGQIVTCTVSTILDKGIEVLVNENLPGFIRKADLSRDRSEQRPDRFAVGEKVDAKVTSVDRTSRKVNLSIKSREIDEEKQAMAEYGSSDSGASLGDILGAAIRSKQEADDQPEPPEVEAKAPAKKVAKAAKDEKKTKATTKAKTSKAKAKKPAEAAKETAAEATDKAAKAEPEGAEKTDSPGA